MQAASRKKTIIVTVTPKAPWQEEIFNKFNNRGFISFFGITLLNLFDPELPVQATPL